jgi:hypothetical protein
MPGRPSHHSEESPTGGGGGQSPQKQNFPGHSHPKNVRPSGNHPRRKKKNVRQVDDVFYCFPKGKKSNRRLKLLPPTQPLPHPYSSGETKGSLQSRPTRTRKTGGHSWVLPSSTCLFVLPLPPSPPPDWWCRSPCGEKELREGSAALPGE